MSAQTTFILFAHILRAAECRTPVLRQVQPTCLPSWEKKLQFLLQRDCKITSWRASAPERICRYFDSCGTLFWVLCTVILRAAIVSAHNWIKNLTGGKIERKSIGKGKGWLNKPKFARNLPFMRKKYNFWLEKHVFYFQRPPRLGLALLLAELGFLGLRIWEDDY